MTTYVLSLTGDEEKAANARHWARLRTAKLLSISRSPADGTAVDGAAREGMIDADRGAGHRRETGGWPAARDPAALALLLVRTLDIQDGIGVVLADFDSEDFAADVVARITALGRDVTCAGEVARFAFGSSVRRRLWRA